MQMRCRSLACLWGATLSGPPLQDLPRGIAPVPGHARPRFVIIQIASAIKSRGRGSTQLTTITGGLANCFSPVALRKFFTVLSSNPSTQGTTNPQVLRSPTLLLAPKYHEILIYVSEKMPDNNNAEVTLCSFVLIVMVDGHNNEYILLITISMCQLYGHKHLV